MPSMKVKINGNNMNVLNSNSEDEKLCNCPKNATCPLNGECLRNDIVYQATVTCGETSESYVGITATSFKARLANHKASFKSKEKRNATELSKHTWDLKGRDLNYAIKWIVLCKVPHYTEKFFILCKQNTASLNKRSELLSKCRHKDKFLLKSS